MISVVRSAEPKILVDKKATWLADLNAASLALTAATTNQQKTAAKQKFARIQKKYGHSKVKKALEKMLFDKCAYCESVINIVTVGHIEHFKPKRFFQSLTFEWTNLLLSCPKCNDKAHKGDKFPAIAVGGPLIDPAADNPSTHFAFQYDPVTKQALAIPKTNRGAVTEDIFKLNTRKHLVKARSSYVRNLIFVKASVASDPEAAFLVAEAMQPDAPYLAWAKAIP